MTPYTAIADIIDPEVLADQISAKFPDKLVLGGSGIVEVDTTFKLGSPGTKFTIPFWKRIAAFEALTEGTPMTPGKIGTDSEECTVQRAGSSFEVYDTAPLVSKSDPMTEISDQLARRAAEYIDSALVVEAQKTPNVSDITGGAESLVEASDVITAMLLLGDNHASLLNGGVAIMHSKVYGDLLKSDDLQNVGISGNDILKTGRLGTICGFPIILSDRVTQTSASSRLIYNLYLVGPGALALFYQRNVKTEFDRDILLQADVVASTVHFAPHLFGYDDGTTAVVAEDSKSIHVVILKSN